MDKVKIDEKTINEAISKVDLAKDSTIQEAVDMLLGGNAVNVGSYVTTIADCSYPYEGARGKVKGVSAKGSGWVDVEFADGTVVPLERNLLIPV